MQPIKILNIRAAISKIKYIGDGKICLIDENNTIRIYDVNNFRLIDGFKIKLPKNNPQENSVNISNNGTYAAVSVRSKHKVTIWSIKNKKLIYTLGWHKGDILSVEFDKEEKYLISGGEDGRSYIWSMTTGKMVSSLPPHADYITSVAFSKNSLWGATGSYDKSVTITNISSMDISYRKRIHRGAVTLLKFMNKQKLLSGDKTGELAVWNYAKGKVEQRLPGMVDRTLDAAFDLNEKYMFSIAEGSGKIALFDMETYDLITDNFIKISELPNVIEFIPDVNYIVIGTMDGGVYFFDLYEDERKLKKFVKNSSYIEAYELAAKNPFLKYTDTFEEIENRWNKTLDSAQKMFEKGETDLAKQLLNPYLKIPEKRGLIQSLLNDFSEFEKFKNAVNNAKYPLAYSLAAKYPYLKNTFYYKKMEEVWKKTFSKAKTLIFQKGMDDEVKELLKPFRGVTEKTPFIQALFNQKQLYKLFNQKLHKKEFSEFFALVKRFPFLADSDEYQKAVKYAQQLIKKAKEFLKKGEYKKVINISELLINFPMHKEEAEELLQQAKILLEFHRVLATHDYNLIDKFVKDHPFLEDVDDYQELERKWRNKLENAEIYASKGNVFKVLEELHDYMDITDKRFKIGQLIKSAYLQQIISLILKMKENPNYYKFFQEAVKNYIKIFGFDMEISDLTDKVKKMKIDVDLDNVQEGDMSNWHLYKLPEKIWEDMD